MYWKVWGENRETDICYWLFECCSKCTHDIARAHCHQIDVYINENNNNIERASHKKHEITFFLYDKCFEQQYKKN